MTLFEKQNLEALERIEILLTQILLVVGHMPNPTQAVTIEEYVRALGPGAMPADCIATKPIRPEAK